MEMNGVIFDNIGLAVVGGGVAVHKNNKAAKGSWVLYEIIVEGKTFRFGIADATRLVKEGKWKGLPVRLAQQLSKIDRYAPELALAYKMIALKRVTTKAEALIVESKVIIRHAIKFGIPLGNLAEIKKWASKYGKGKLSLKALKALKKFLKF